MSALAVWNEAVAMSRSIDLEDVKHRVAIWFGRISRWKRFDVEDVWPRRVDGSAGLRRTPVAIDVENERFRVARRP